MDWAIDGLESCLVESLRMGFKRHFGDFLQRLIFKFVSAVTLPKGCAYIGSSASAEVVDVWHCSALCRVIGFYWLVLRPFGVREQTHRASHQLCDWYSVMGIRPCSIPSQIRHSDTSCSSSHLLWLNWWTSDGWCNVH